ncbi:MAG: ZIP family metal transporter [Clostridia bacterium]|nr:ZIP family metal transporter [Clostridia bacterium]
MYDIVAIGLLIPFVGTVLGSSMVYLLKDKINPKVQKLLFGFASGVMVAASVWSLLIPSMEMSVEQGGNGWLPAGLGFLLGVGFLLVLDKVVPHEHALDSKHEGPKSKASKRTMLTLAVTIHNIPEGMAVGVVLAGALAGQTTITTMGVLALAIGIALQNFPEGAIISLPLKTAGNSKHKAFLSGVLSGVVEPIAGLVTVLLASFVTPILPYVLSFAAGAMIYVVVEELIPDSQDGQHSDWGTIGVALGFVLMMVLDVALG